MFTVAPSCGAIEAYLKPAENFDHEDPTLDHVLYNETQAIAKSKEVISSLLETMAMSADMRVTLSARLRALNENPQEVLAESIRVLEAKTCR